MADRTVITSQKAARYHVDEACPGWQQGRKNSADRGHDLHAVLRVPEKEAQQLGKKRCLRCGGRR
jgi:hypothetical protein